MSAHDAEQALEALGLSSYEARVFVALQRLGAGTAQAISEVSEVPRSQVYGAAAGLADRGLVEVVESSPKRFRAVGLDAAREQLQAQMARTSDRAFENLAALRDDRSDHADDGEVSTLHGRHAVDRRVAALVERATDQVVLVVAGDHHVADGVEAALRERAGAGVRVLVVADDEAIVERFGEGPIRVVRADSARTAGFTGRTLLVDDATVLLSVDAEEGHDAPFEETALWTAGTSIGHILARFVHAGMRAGLGGDAGGPNEF